MSIRSQTSHLENQNYVISPIVEMTKIKNLVFI